MRCAFFYADTVNANSATLSIHEKFEVKYIPSYLEQANGRDAAQYLDSR